MTATTRPTASSRRASSPELGAVTPFVMLLCVALVALLALVVDGGRVLNARETALSEAEQAARAGAVQLSASSLHGGLTAVQVASAIATAERYMAASGHPGSATVAGTVVVTTVRFLLPTPLLALVGISALPVSASAAATAVVG
ncbi:MAG TPA: pilus assembly protein TadG-related protein [Acidimicrobiales bacterium]|nr:pilus assembly protein TadG-related protein [Acidimicrobiales bacterium]